MMIQGDNLRTTRRRAMSVQVRAAADVDIEGNVLVLEGDHLHRFLPIQYHHFVAEVIVPLVVHHHHQVGPTVRDPRTDPLRDHTAVVAAIIPLTAALLHTVMIGGVRDPLPMVVATLETE